MNALANLRWDTRLENARDRKRFGLSAEGEKNAAAKLNEAKVIEILSTRGRHTELASRFHVSAELIGRIRSGVNLPPTNPDDATVTALPVTPRPALDEAPMLQAVPYSHCKHLFATFTVDVDAAKCFCKDCGGEVSPIFVLEQLMKQESRWNRTRDAYQDEMKRLAERSRTKCQHCGEMTRITNR